MILISFIPPNDTFNAMGFILLIFILTITIGGLGALLVTLRQRILAIKVPSEYRNSIYSLFPTITMLFQIPMLIITGTIIEAGGLLAGLVVILAIGIVGSVLLLLYHFFDKEESSFDLKTKSGEIS